MPAVSFHCMPERCHLSAPRPQGPGPGLRLNSPKTRVGGTLPSLSWGLHLVGSAPFQECRWRTWTLQGQHLACWLPAEEGSPQDRLQPSRSACNQPGEVSQPDCLILSLGLRCPLTHRFNHIPQRQLQWGAPVGSKPHVFIPTHPPPARSLSRFRTQPGKRGSI